MAWQDIHPYAVGLAITLAIYGALALIARGVGPGFNRLLDRLFGGGGADKGGAALRPGRRQQAITFPYEHQHVSGEDALEAWEQARLAGKGIPVVIGGRWAETLIGPDWTVVEGETPEDILREADAMGNPPEPEPMQRRPRPLVPSSATKGGPMLHHDLPSMTPLPRVLILWLPARSSAEIPAYLNLGGWNACPEAAVMVATLRKWQKQYGAELFGLTEDAMDLRVTRRPDTAAEAIRLAREQVEFCSDVVEDPDEMLEELAADLMATDWWHFWWD